MTVYRRWGKRALDVVLAIALFTVTSPVHGLVALAVRVTSGRPIYFRQERIGRGGSPFRLVKFRTMDVGTHESSGGYPSAACITPIGRLLRKTSLDELPQLLNVLRGEMSFVGPRPTLAEQVARYTPEQRGRLSERPGVTGLAQVRYRNEAPWSVRIQSDLEYVTHVSLLRDLTIMVKTVPSVLSGGGVAEGQTREDVDDLGQEPVRDRDA
ncbi:MAG: sugar transferase [Nocardioides sp.]|nr:sugar transferase [Nocardioides sp.]